MKFTAIAALTTALLAAPAFADGHATGDAAAGEKIFKKCKSCHMIVADDGTTIQKGGKTGPNLYGVFGRTAGGADFKYGKSLAAAGENGLEWNEAEFVAFVADPKKYLAAYLDDSKAKSKMSFKLKKAEEAANVWAYLVSVGPAS
ncbi:MAG: c-type cytochrome [Paracoccaceae bacterium]